MLTGKDIGQLIEQPESISVDQLDAIAELSVKYPYAELFSILYLKGMHSSASLDFETALKEHSYRISDRAQLFELIHAHDEKRQSQLENDEQVALEPENEAEFEIEKHVEEDKLELHDDSFALNTEEYLESETEILPTEEREAPYVSSESEAENDEVLEESDLLPIDLPNDPLEENILHHIHAVQYQLDALSPEEEAALAQKAVKSEDESEPELEVDGKTKVDSEHQNKDAGLSFTGWLHADINYEEKEDEQASIKAVVQDFAAFDPLESLSGDVEKPKKEFFSPTKKAKESLNESQLPVSETLAKVYAVQGNYPKAIAAYNELILAFPEKKSFFADQIEDLQKKLNT